MKEKINRMLLAMLGSDDLVEKWWNSPNLYFEGITPNEVYAENPELVRNYVFSYYDR